MGDACRTANLGRSVNFFRASARELSSGPSNSRRQACRAGRRPDGQSMLRRRRQIEPSGQPERGLPVRVLAIPALAVAPVLPLTHRTSQYRPQQHDCSQRPKQPSHSFRTETAEHSPHCRCPSQSTASVSRVSSRQVRHEHWRSCTLQRDVCQTARENSLGDRRGGGHWLSDCPAVRRGRSGRGGKRHRFSDLERTGSSGRRRPREGDRPCR